nr:MAG TPA: hypothetical protein [Caudoviricetes sp.]
MANSRPTPATSTTQSGRCDPHRAGAQPAL